MPAPAVRRSGRQFKGVKPESKDYALTNGDGLQHRARSNGSALSTFNCREPLLKKRINMGFETSPSRH
ncbi:integrase [Pseudomonas sp. 34 E 7]|nr:integrase [Pseudomonas sp. 34 E 7]